VSVVGWPVLIVEKGGATNMWILWVVGVAAVTLLIVAFGRCSHRDATLQPPVRGAGPDRDHARWYCDRCGHTWDAGMESSTRPRVIYQGYDEHKAAKAAVRADALDKQRRRLATKRGGGSRQRPSRPATAARPGPRPLGPVLDQRAVGFTEHDSSRPFAAMRRARD
jgi:hypothetical protein